MPTPNEQRPADIDQLAATGGKERIRDPSVAAQACNDEVTRTPPAAGDVADALHLEANRTGQMAQRQRGLTRLVFFLILVIVIALAVFFAL